MENLDLSISKDGIELLKSLIGQKLISFMHEKTDNAIVFQKIEIFSSNGRYLIDNDVNWFDDYFSGPEDVPVLDFKKMDDDENPFETWPENATTTQSVNESITNILVVQDDCDAYENGTFLQHLTSSEGIIFVTDKVQYGFFKDNMWLDEEVEIIIDEKDVLSKAEILKDHYKIFGYPFSGKCKRSIISLKDGVLNVVDTAEEIPTNSKEK